MDINPLACLGLALASVPGPHLGAPDQDKATSILQKVLKNQRKVDYLHIETRGSASWNVKVQTSVTKGIMVTILAPSYKQGLVTVDDTKITQTYQPDVDSLAVQPSPYQLQPSFDFRWTLIKQNYTVQSGRSTTIAGEPVRELIVKPVNEDIPTRHMYVDANHSVVLRYTVDSNERRPVVIFDTKYVEFGADAANTGFGLPAAASTANRFVYPGPTKLLGPSDSRAEAGFSARMPEKLPYGFKVSGAYLFRSVESGPYVQVKITDGMVSLTVFQWRKGKKAPNYAEFVQKDAFNVNYGIAVIQGDWMPNEVLERLIEEFVSSSE